MCAAITSAAGSAAWNFSAPTRSAPRPRRRRAPTRAGTPRTRPGMPARDGSAARSAGTRAAATATRACIPRTAARPRPEGRAAREATGRSDAASSSARRRSRRPVGGDATPPRGGVRASRRWHGSARNRHNPATCSCRNCSEPRCRSMPAGFRADRAPRARAYVAVYIWRWRISRREGGARAAGGGRLALWLTGVALLFVALISPVDRLGEQLATMHMVQHLLLADLVPICLTLALTKHILRPATRRIHRIEREAGPFGHPAFGVVAYVAAMWIWHVPALYDAAVEHSLHPRARAPELRRRRPPVLVAPAVADPLADAARRRRPRALHGLDEAPRRLPGHPARLLPRRSSTRSTRPTARAGGCRRSTTSTSPAS